MNLIADSFRRALADCLRPRILALSLLPLLAALVLGAGFFWLFWDGAVAGVRNWLATGFFFPAVWNWFERWGAPDFTAVLAPALVLLAAFLAALALILILTGLIVPSAVAESIAARRFPTLERRGKDSVMASVGWAVGQTALALLALLVTLPLWLIPPLIFILPLVIWGWLTARVMSFDALGVHATAQERRALLRAHRWPLLAIGAACVYVSAAPALVWASFIVFAVAFVVLIPLGLWIYTLVFAFSALWFTHYGLGALQARRGGDAGATRPSDLPASRFLMNPDPHPPAIGLIVIGDEILSGRRSDKHLAKMVELLSARNLALAWAEYVGDDAARITVTLRRAFASADVVISTGGIGSTPDDLTRACAAAALGVPLVAHPEAQRLITARMERQAQEKGEAFEPARADNLQRLKMGEFPQGAGIIPNPYNQIPGFFCRSASGATVYFTPGFPVMAWPMMAWALEREGAARLGAAAWQERSVIIHGSGEALLTPLMERIEAAHPAVKVFSLPSVDDPTYGACIDLGVKGRPEVVGPAFDDLMAQLRALPVRCGPTRTRP